MRVRWRDFHAGWWPMGAREAMPAGTLRRAVGVNAIKTGTLRSRWGSTLIASLAAHSLYRFRGSRFVGSGSVLFRDGVAIQGSLSGSRLRFVRMAPMPGDEDYLFVAGGSVPGKVPLFKVAPNGAVSQWGIDAPLTNFAAAAGAAGVLNGTYQYAVTFLNSTTGSRSNPNPAMFALPPATPVTVTPANQVVNLTVIPISSDPQVTRRELWRTFANQGVFFKLAEIANNTATTYTDNAADTALQTLELPLDNDPPQPEFNDAVGPYAGRMWWARISSAGNEGRVYYSPVGRPEAVAAFLEINNGDDPTQRAVFWGGSLYVFTNARIVQILNFDEPFTWREVFGAPGTTQPFSVTPTPFGILYDSIDGIRMFDGTASKLVGYEAIGRLLTGEALEGVPAFDAVIGEFAGREVWLSDTVTTLVLDPADGSWRIAVGGLTALYFEPDTQFMTGSYGGIVARLEVPITLTDNGAAIAFEVETPGLITDEVARGMVQRVFIDASTSGQLVTPTLVLDGNAIVLPPFKTDGRPTQAIEYEIGRWGRVASVRLDATLTAQVEVFEIAMDVYLPGAT